METLKHENDPYLWLEEVEGDKALQWVRERNRRTLEDLGSRPLFAALKEEITPILFDREKLPSPALKGGQVYNFWQDEHHARGVLRRTSLEEYGRAEPTWETVLDVDALAAREKENWVYQYSDLLPGSGRGLLYLSRGGKDANVLREFDFSKKEFVKDGFSLPESKGWACWLDRDSLFIGRDFGPGTLTSCGYPRQVRLWKRGTPWESAELVFEVPESSVSAYASVDPTEPRQVLFHDRPTFFRERIFRPSESGLQPFPMPESADSHGFFQGWVIAWLRKPLERKAGRLDAGAVVAIPYGASSQEEIELVYSPSPVEAMQEIAITRNGIFLSLLRDLQPALVEVSRQGERWNLAEIPVPENTTVGFSPRDDLEEKLLVRMESFLEPPGAYLLRDGRLLQLKRSRPYFEAGDLEARQFFATSADGTRIPYFLVHKKELRPDGQNPTLLHAYGGFENAKLPDYNGPRGKVWLEKGGVYALANIRGGGEYGPRWHQAALLEKRQRCYDDFIAVSEHLIQEKITSAGQLVIQGGSNGGLLMGAMYTQRPDLFRGIVCSVPLLDMLRYHKLLAGASWMEEYGDPEDPRMRECLLRYSPYQNVKAEVKYPEIFFMTSTKDDRVHPGHARKMAARLEELGHRYHYYENTDGGHAGVKDIAETVDRTALMYCFFWSLLQSKRRSHA